MYSCRKINYLIVHDFKNLIKTYVKQSIEIRKIGMLNITVQILAVADSVRIMFQYSLCQKKERLV